MYFSYDIIIVTVTSDGFQLNESIATFFFFFFSLFVNRKEKKIEKKKKEKNGNTNETTFHPKLPAQHSNHTDPTTCMTLIKGQSFNFFMAYRYTQLKKKKEKPIYENGAVITKN